MLDPQGVVMVNKLNLPIHIHVGVEYAITVKIITKVNAMIRFIVFFSFFQIGLKIKGLLVKLLTKPNAPQRALTRGTFKTLSGVKGVPFLIRIPRIKG